MIPAAKLEAISFRNIFFSYPSRPVQQALINFSLNIAPGESVALVGPSGAGKSTMFQLLLRFYQMQQGNITLGDVNIVLADLKQLRQQDCYCSPGNFNIRCQCYGKYSLRKA